MSKIKYILIVVLCTLSLYTFSQDYVRMGDRSLSGTARYVGMSGAMTAIGGDPSASMDNPAGLGLYRRPELMLSFDYTWDRTMQNADASLAKRVNRFDASQASLVIAFGPYKDDADGVLFNSIMFSYRRLQTYWRDMTASATSGASLGSLLAYSGLDLGIPYCVGDHSGNQLVLRETGVVNEYAFDWGMNISNRWYFGAGVHTMSYRLLANARYVEQFDFYDADGRQCYNDNNTSLTYTGVGFNFTTGIIYRPVSWVRLGFSLQTPSLGRLNIYSRGTLTSLTDSIRDSSAPDLATNVQKFHMPFHLSTSAAFQCGYYGMLALQYDFSHQAGELDIHTLRAGLEIVPIPGMYINAGYAYESTFKANNSVVSIDPTFDRQDTYFQRMKNTQYVSAAIGFRGTHVIAQAAYQFRWQNINLYAHEYAIPYNMFADTHRLVVTIGWHRGW